MTGHTISDDLSDLSKPVITASVIEESKVETIAEESHLVEQVEQDETPVAVQVKVKEEEAAKPTGKTEIEINTIEEVQIQKQSSPQAVAPTEELDSITDKKSASFHTADAEDTKEADSAAEVAPAVQQEEILPEVKSDSPDD